MTNTNVIGKLKTPIRTLRTIQTVAPKAIIAGGYYRDIFNGVQFSDVDIYVEYSPSKEFNPTYESTWIKALDLKVDNFLSSDSIHEMGSDDEDYRLASDTHMISVFAMVKDDTKYNIIVVDKHPVDYVKAAFDFNICMNWCDGRRIHFPKQFMTDVENKTITFSERRMSLTEFAHSMDVHLPKLQHKYPHHKLIVPDIHRDLHKKYKRNC